MHVEYAAHVGHGLAHTPEGAKLGLALAGVLIAVAVVAATTTATGGAAAIALIAAASKGAGYGLKIGDIADNYAKKAIVERIATGFEPVRLGPVRRAAARAFTDTNVGSGHGDEGKPVVEGSEIVMLGRERKPMARREDRAQCRAEIAEGLKTLLVGGKPSLKGQEWSETDSKALQTVKLLQKLFGLVGAKPVKIVATVAKETLERTDHPKLAAGVSAAETLSSPPKSALDLAKKSKSLTKDVNKMVREVKKPPPGT